MEIFEGEKRREREREMEVSRMDYRGGKSIRSVKFPGKVVIKDQRVRRVGSLAGFSNTFSARDTR